MGKSLELDGILQKIEEHLLDSGSISPHLITTVVIEFAYDSYLLFLCHVSQKEDNFLEVIADIAIYIITFELVLARGQIVDDIS